MNRKRPNVLYIFADQWRRQAVGFMNEDNVYTPQIDRFSQEGLVFKQAVSCTPLCSPHRSSLMTGKYALSTGVYTNCKTGLDVMLSPEEVCIGDVLKQNGYATGYIGKWHLDLPEQNATERPESGAKEWDAYTPPGPKRHGFDYWYSYGTFDEHLTPHYWEDTPDRIEVNQWSVEHETDKALEFIEARSKEDTPFSLFLSWNPPHSPFDLVPDQYKDIYSAEKLEQRANVVINDQFLVHTGETIAGGGQRWEQSVKDYFAAISGIDEQFGRLIEKLEQLNIAQNTIVVLTSDHGELLGSHEMMAKHSWHEESIGVPFIISWPGRIEAGMTSEILNTVDIMPTLLELMELPVPTSVEGCSVADMVLGRASESSKLGRVGYISAFPGRLEAIKAFQEAGLDNRHYGWRGVRSRRYAYVVHKGYFPSTETTRMFYDLEVDPFQLNPLYLNRASDHPTAALLEGHLINYLIQTKDGFRL